LPRRLSPDAPSWLQDWLRRQRSGVLAVGPSVREVLLAEPVDGSDAEDDTCFGDLAGGLYEDDIVPEVLAEVEEAREAVAAADLGHDDFRTAIITHVVDGTVQVKAVHAVPRGRDSQIG
jgi:hypothetical protein